MLTAKIWAFIRRDFIIDTSYKFSFVFDLIGSALPLVTFYFVGKLVDSSSSADFKFGGHGYFQFVIIGVSLTQYFMTAMSAFADTVRREQMEGCLEAMLSTRTSPMQMIMLSPLYSFLFNILHLIIILAAGGFFFGVDYSTANISGALVILILTILAFSGIGILSAAVIVLIKKGDPVEWIFGSILTLISGAYFPVSVLPGWLQKTAEFSPLKYSLDGLRLALFSGYNIFQLRNNIYCLGIAAGIILPLGILFFSRAVNKGRKDGSLMKY
ncbi:MAG: hypothetical protein A2096_08705 [Spirochaetes bacterium GWF1_41_5]|nr:MAG: hypothetical protein A2096_08705 [Spirochaetes bacterium GWF1_41_5]HBE03870.1 ABC transporter permease [Spirochaetia bacterium]